MANVRYETLKMQSYFTSSETKIEDKRTIFKYRVRMEKFGENYRGKETSIPCPLCHTHIDKQEMSFMCPIIRKDINIKGKFSDIYEEDIEKDTIQTILKISKYRKQKLENE